MKDRIKNKQAVALKYNSDKDSAPVMTAKGKGYVADKLIEEALKHNIPIQEDPSLVKILAQLELNESIPEQLYEVVAEVLAFVYRIEKNLPEAKNK